MSMFNFITQKGNPILSERIICIMESKMGIQNDKDFTVLPEIAKLYQACKERDLTIAEREYLKGARDAWQAAKAQAVPEGFVVVDKKLIKTLHEELLDHEPDSFVVIRDICELWEQANDEEIKAGRRL